MLIRVMDYLEGNCYENGDNVVSEFTRNEVGSWREGKNPVNTITERIPAEFELDYEFGKMLGLYVASGTEGVKFREDGDRMESRCVTYWLGYGRDSCEKRDFLNDYYKTQGLKVSHISTGDSTLVLDVGNRLYGRFISSLVGSTEETKKFNDALWEGGVEFNEGFLEGLFKGRGITTRFGVKVEFRNKELAYQIGKLANKCGMEPEVRVNDVGPETICTVFIHIRTQKQHDFVMKVANNPSYIVVVNKQENMDKEGNE